MSIELVMKQFEDHLMRLPNVNGIAIGEDAGEQVIIVFVTRKLPLSDLRLEERIPDELDGYRIDVREIGTVATQQE